MEGGRDRGRKGVSGIERGWGEEGIEGERAGKRGRRERKNNTYNHVHTQCHTHVPYIHNKNGV